MQAIVSLVILAVAAGKAWELQAQDSISTTEAAYYRVEDVLTGISPTGSRDQRWQPDKGLALEISGMDVLPDGRLAVAIRKGEVWILDGFDLSEPEKLSYRRFAQALHEPMGLACHGGAIYVAQRTELTRLRDVDGDGEADEYKAVASNWQLAGNYHEYVYGPKIDGSGSLWITLNIGMGQDADNALPWRGWGLKLDPQGQLMPASGGMRSPCGLGANAAGDMFFTDQQGTWVPAGTLHHLRPGVFFGNAEALETLQHPDSPVRLSGPVPKGKPYPDAIRALPELVPPAAWFPYHKMGESATDIVLIDSGGKFGPFEGQLLVGEFRSAAVNRVFLEKVHGQYQGACFPFRSGFASGVYRLCFAKDGSLLAGMTNRGWTSVGRASYGLQRVVWTGQTPFEIERVHALSDGFELVFTKPVDTRTAGDRGSYSGQSYTYWYHATYGSDEIQPQALEIRSATVSDDQRRVRLAIGNLRELFVHELHLRGVRSVEGEPVLHPVAYYTLNGIP